MKNLKVAIDRTQWRQNNVLMVSVIWQKRALPLYWQLLPTVGCSDQDEKKEVIEAILPLLKGYKVVVLGDREFGTVGFANWLQKKGLVHGGVNNPRLRFMQISRLRLIILV